MDAYQAVQEQPTFYPPPPDYQQQQQQDGSFQNGMEYAPPQQEDAAPPPAEAQPQPGPDSLPLPPPPAPQRRHRWGPPMDEVNKAGEGGEAERGRRKKRSRWEEPDQPSMAIVVAAPPGSAIGSFSFPKSVTLSGGITVRVHVTSGSVMRDLAQHCPCACCAWACDGMRSVCMHMIVMSSVQHDPVAWALAGITGQPHMLKLSHNCHPFMALAARPAHTTMHACCHVF